MPLVLTQQPTAALSASISSLPDGCLASRRGLQLPKDLSYHDWHRAGRSLTEVSAAATWMLGDWLAFGHATYLADEWGGKTPEPLYEELAQATGFAVLVLKNARAVSEAFPLEWRSDRVTFNHASEIVGRAPAEDWEGWVKTLNESDPALSVKQLRVLIRQKYAHKTASAEASDKGDRSPLEGARQLARDWESVAKTAGPRFREELKSILTPVLRDLGLIR